MILSEKIYLHFAHANGFPAGSYQQIFNALDHNLELYALTKFAHSKQFPVNTNLANQVAELIDYLQKNLTQPVYAVGHSLGAVVSFMAACERPDLIKGLIMLDPPIASGLSRIVFRLIKCSPLIDRFSPAGKAKGRCQYWPKDSNLVEYFQARRLFKDFLPACVADYVAAAIDEKEDGFYLNFDAQIEADIYRNVPHNINKYYKRLQVPALLVTGGNSDVCEPAWLSTFIKKTKIEHMVLPDTGHMFPLEIPQQVAQIINERIRLWEMGQ
jgi:pimeloyl-ACP methyl ester carboxylesterase